MNINSSLSRLFALPLAACLVAVALSSSAQGILIDIDETDPSAVIFLGTAANANITDTGISMAYGFDLAGFFTASVSSYGGSVAGTLQFAQSGLPTYVYNTWQGDHDNANGLYDDVNLVNSAASGPTSAQEFFLGNQAFSGSATVNLSNDTGGLPGLNATGLIYVGNTGYSGSVNSIGYWQVVAAPAPEPSTCALLGMGIAALLAHRRGRSSP